MKPVSGPVFSGSRLITAGLVTAVCAACCTAALASYMPFAPGPGTELITGLHITDLAMADLDGDLDLDVVACSSMGGSDPQVAWMENIDGRGSYASAVVLHQSTSVEYVDLCSGDFDGDGDTDLAAADATGGDVVWFENLGGGTFSGQLLVDASMVTPNSVASGDFDGNGITDLAAVSGSASSQTRWYACNQGSWTATQVSQIGLLSNPERVAAADVDGDGDVDVLTVDVGEDAVSWFENPGNGDFDPATRHVVDNNSGSAADVAVADFNGDGDMEVAKSTYTADNVIEIYDGDPRGTNTMTLIWSVTGHEFERIQALDFDGDGDIDILASGNDTGQVLYFDNNGTGTGFTGHVMATGSAPLPLSAGDVDGDGALDLAVGWTGDMKATLHRGVFRPATDQGRPTPIDPNSPGCGAATWPAWPAAALLLACARRRTAWPR
jgi:hypothetical protein